MRTEHHLRVQEWLERLVGLSTTARVPCLRELDAQAPAVAADVRSIWPHFRRLETVCNIEHRSLPPARARNSDLEGEEAVPFCVDQFRATRRIGQGGMGVVYHALRANNDAPFALKILRRTCLLTAQRRRFEYEIEIHRQLLHPGHEGIARLVYHGVAGEKNENTLGTSVHHRPYFAMEFVDGEAINRYVARRRSSLLDRLVLFTRVCEVVRYLHSRDIIHRDLKPSNILADASGCPKIIDFGIARIGPEQFQYLPSETGWLVGTVQYASPEQLQGKIEELTPQSDIYSLGLICVELLTGAPARRCGPQGSPTVRRPIPAELLPTPEIRSVFCHGMEHILSKAVQPRPCRRYASVQCMAQDIQVMIELIRRSCSGWSWRRIFRSRELSAPDPVHAALVALRRFRAEQAVAFRLM